MMEYSDLLCIIVEVSELSTANESERKSLIYTRLQALFSLLKKGPQRKRKPLGYKRRVIKKLVRPSFAINTRTIMRPLPKGPIMEYYIQLAREQKDRLTFFETMGMTRQEFFAQPHEVSTSASIMRGLVAWSDSHPAPTN